MESYREIEKQLKDVLKESPLNEKAIALLVNKLKLAKKLEKQPSSHN